MICNQKQKARHGDPSQLNDLSTATEPPLWKSGTVLSDWDIDTGSYISRLFELFLRFPSHHFDCPMYLRSYRLFFSFSLAITQALQLRSLPTVSLNLHDGALFMRKRNFALLIETRFFHVMNHSANIVSMYISRQERLRLTFPNPLWVHT